MHGRRRPVLPLLDLIFPIWMGAFAVLPLLFVLNYLWDGIVLTLSAGKALRRVLGWWRLLRETLYACLIGFAVDLVASIALLAADEALGIHRSGTINGHPFHNTVFGLGPFAVHTAVVALAGFVIWQADRRLLGRRSLDLDPVGVRRVARWLAILTTPYLLLLPAYF